MLSWDSNPTEFLRTVESDMTSMVKEITLYAFGQLIHLSPVDTGAYRSNHRLTLGAPDDGYDTSITDQRNLAQAKDEVARLKIPYTVAYLQNSLPYAPALEGGSSEQAPGGVYGVAFNSILEKYGR